MTALLNVHLSDRWEDLAADLARELRHLDGDPFASIPVVVNGQAAARRLSQVLATSLADDGLGICAGVEFTQLPRLRRQLEADLLGLDPARDPWRSRGLSMAVLEVLDECLGEPWFETVEHHLRRGESRPGRRAATADRIARLFLRYCRTAPEMVRAWSLGRDVGEELEPLPQHELWQPRVWQRVRALLEPVPDPVRRHDELVAALGHGDQRGDVLRVFDPVPAAPLDRALVQAIAETRPVHLWLLDQSGLDDALVERFGALRAASVQRWRTAATSDVQPCAPAGAPTGGLLGALQGAANPALHDSPAHHTPAHDASVQVHSAHGLDRQVEVLREVLVGLFEDDPSLEPRDVVVACTDLAAAAPLVRASFQLDRDRIGPLLHPGHELRVQLADASLAQPNQVLVGLAQLLDLVAGRATAQELLDLCNSPSVVARFDLGEDERERIGRLVGQADVRWGLDGTHRADFGLGQVRQSTWLAGLDRVLVGVAMGQNPPSWLGTALPLEQVESNDVVAAGKLAEIVSRVRKQAAELRADAPIGTWVTRLQSTIELLLGAPRDQAWQVGAASAELADLADLTTDRTALLGLGDVRALFDRLLRVGRGRPNHGNGSLLVCGLDDLGSVPHRVVAVLGLDDHRFPARPARDGDDVVERVDVELDPRARSRQWLLDALAAARDHFVVVHQGFDPRTNEPLPEPVALADLVAACRRHSGGSFAVVTHPLMPHSPDNFTQHSSGSFDVLALAGARARERALVDPAPAPLPLWQQVLAPDPGPDAELDQLVAFFRHPARELLRRSLGVTMGSWDDPLSDELPLDPNFLDDWRIGNRMVELALAGLDPAQVEAAERLRGDLPPGVLGSRVLSRLMPPVRKVVDATLRVSAGERDDHDCVLPLAEGRLTGRVRTHGSIVASHAFSKTSGQHLLQAWLPLLLLAATTPAPVGGWRAVHVGRDAMAVLQAPPADACAELLQQYAALRRRGLQRLVPLPAKTAAEMLSVTPLRPYGEQDAGRNARRAWARSDHDDDWDRFLGGEWDDLLALPPEPDDPGLMAGSRFQGLADWMFGPVRAQMAVENLR